MKLSIIAALMAGSMFATTALAQDTSNSASGSLSNATGVGSAVNGPISNGSASNSDSNSNGSGVGIATNGPISNGSQSSSNTKSNAISGSLATGGAGGNSTSNAAGGTSMSNATGGNSGAANAANAQNTNLTVQSNTVIPRDTTSHFAPQVVASGLTTSNDTCMGSTSAGLSLIGGGGTLGTTWDDKACARRQNAVRLYAMGWRAEACEVMLQDASVQAAFARTGRHCEDMADNELVPLGPAPMAAPPPPQLPPPPPAPAQAAPQPPEPQPTERGANDHPPAAPAAQASIDTVMASVAEHNPLAN